MNIGIYTYGNLGRGVELAVNEARDMELVGVFTRREPESVKTAFEGTKVYRASDVLDFREAIDVLIVCGGSASDLPEMSPRLARDFNIIDSFDTHAAAFEHIERCRAEGIRGKHSSVISCGWDPGLFSLLRLYSNLLGGEVFTFWGEGVSQGHSDALRRIKGVKDAIEITVPNEDALLLVLNGEGAPSVYDMHKRVCYVALDEGTDEGWVKDKIVNMPEYFFGYETEVNFVSLCEIAEKRGKMSHGGRVISAGRTGAEGENRFFSSFYMKLGSNPEFTARVLTAYARAAYRMYLKGEYGARSVFDIPPSYLIPLGNENIGRELL